MSARSWQFCYNGCHASPSGHKCTCHCSRGKPNEEILPGLQMSPSRHEASDDLQPNVMWSQQEMGISITANDEVTVIEHAKEDQDYWGVTAFFKGKFPASCL